MQQVLAGMHVELNVEIVRGLLDFWSWVQPLEAGVTGITIREHGEAVNHVFGLSCARICLITECTSKGAAGTWTMQSRRQTLS